MGILEGLRSVIDSKKENENAYIEIENMLKNYLNVFCENNDIDYLLSINDNYKTIEKNILMNRGCDESDIDDVYNIRVIFCEKGYGLLSNPENSNNVLTEVSDLMKNLNDEDLFMQYMIESESQVHGNDQYIEKFIKYLLYNRINMYAEKNYIEKPLNGGYQSYNFNLLASNGKTITIQFRNYLQYFFAEWNKNEAKSNTKKLIKK